MPLAGSPCPGGSTLTTSAPNQASAWVADGPASYWVRSRMRSPSSVRQLRTSSELGDYLAPRWPAVAQVFQIERRVTRGHRTTTEAAYGLTSLPLKQAPAPRLLRLIRDHWHIENRLHWRRDVTLGEDACRVRLGQAPQVLAALNNVVLALMDYLDVDNVAAQTRVFGARPAAALALLLSPL